MPDQRRCGHDIEADPSDPEWRKYCPNVETLDAVELSARCGGWIMGGRMSAAHDAGWPRCRDGCDFGPFCRCRPRADPGGAAPPFTFVRTHCARCHAIDKVSPSPLKVAPPFRTLHTRYPIENLEEALAEGIVTSHPTMPSSSSTSVRSQTSSRSSRHWKSNVGSGSE